MQVMPIAGAATGRRGHLAVRVGAVAATVAVHLVSTPAVAGGPVVCPFRRITGLPCPGCGMTRALSLSAHWHFADAVKMHPLGPALYVGLLVATVAVLVRPVHEVRRRWHEIWVSHPVRVAATVLAGGWLAWAAVRAVRVAIHRDPTW